MDPKNDGLTDSEREILAGLGDDDDDVGGTDDTLNDDGGDADGAADQDGAKADAPSGDDAPAGDGEAATEPEPAKRAEAPIYTATAPDDAAAKLKELAQAKVDARKAYEAGELDEAQYDAKLDEIDQQRDDIKAVQLKAQIAAEMTQQQLAKSYTQTVDTFIADMKRAGIDYRDPKNAAQAAFLNERVKALAQVEHEQTPESWRQLLDDAHALTARKFNIQTKAPEAKAGTQGKDDKPTPPNRKPDLTGIPPTVGRGPGAANTSVGGDEFAHLENLSGIALEREFMKMSPEQQDRYLA